MIQINNANYPNLYLNNSGQKNLLYSEQQSGFITWKLRVRNLFTGIDHIINTPKNHPEYGDVISETHPHTRIDNQYRANLCYIAGFKNSYNAISYYLCYIYSKDLSFDIVDNKNINIVKPTTVGYLDKNNIVYYSKHPAIIEPITTTPPVVPKNQLIQENITPSMQKDILFNNTNIIEILDIKKLENSVNYIMTAKMQEDKLKSYLLDNKFNILQEIFNHANNSIGYCTILNYSLIYAVKNQDNYNLVEEKFYL